jgi:hypothetical protein
VRLAHLKGNGDVLAEIEFSTVVDMNSVEATAISPALRSLLTDKHHRVDTLDVQMTRGSWDIDNHMPSWLDLPPPGLEIAVDFHDSINDTETAFQALLNRLSVVMGVSMSSVYPHGVLGTPTVGWFNGRPVFRRLLFAALTQQTPCIDAANAMLKLLPCHRYLRSQRVIASNLYSLKYQIKRSAQSILCILKLIVVVPPPHEQRWWEGLEDYEGDHSYAAVIQKALGFLIDEKTLGSSCLVPPAARCVYVSAESQLTLQYSNCRDIMPQHASFHPEGNDEGPWKLLAHATVRPLGSISISKTLKLSAEIVAPPTSDHPGASTTHNSKMIHFFQLVPWELDVRWHTLQLSMNGEKLYFKNKHIVGSDGKTVFGLSFLRPAVGSISGTAMEFFIKLPNNTIEPRRCHKIDLSVQVTKKLLSIFDQTPDASRGVDIPAALVTLANVPIGIRSLQHDLQLVHLVSLLENTTVNVARRTVPLLVNLPIADASMPFNVVSFTCTLIALSFSSTVGMLLNPSKKSNDVKKTPFKPKLRRAFLILLVIVTLAVYLDPELQRKVDGWTQSVLGVQVFSTVIP